MAGFHLGEILLLCVTGHCYGVLENLKPNLRVSYAYANHNYSFPVKQ